MSCISREYLGPKQSNAPLSLLSTVPGVSRTLRDLDSQLTMHRSEVDPQPARLARNPSIPNTSDEVPVAIIMDWSKNIATRLCRSIVQSSPGNREKEITSISLASLTIFDRSISVSYS